MCFTDAERVDGVRRERRKKEDLGVIASGEFV